MSSSFVVFTCIDLVILCNQQSSQPVLPDFIFGPNPTKDALKAYSKRIKNKVILLDNPLKITAKEKRALGLYDIPKKCWRYELFVPLHELWTQYINELYGTSNSFGFAQKLLKADLHGAIMTGENRIRVLARSLLERSHFNQYFLFIVSKSKCASYIGVSGIMIQETENMFKIITSSDELKNIPKGHSVFTVNIRDTVFSIYGNQFRCRAALRTTKKFKNKPSIDL
ncbi:9625_t:CDS:2 [Paraglomus occultum]|uniref:9625_t:CDS:1 n=1 Tax=Paraglomus occultum TaxID=144539 RepID=A0A9N9BH82_9GLOM|nr:9625_t:CDS:2 [Paraglomus occultum]